MDDDDDIHACSFSFIYLLSVHILVPCAIQNVLMLRVRNYRIMMIYVHVFLNDIVYRDSIEHLCPRVHNGYQIYLQVFVLMQKLSTCR